MSEYDGPTEEASKVDLDAPGPDSFQAPSIRRWITLSYWTIILLCIPYWWYSTTIERHALPLDRIEQWQNRGLPISLFLSTDDASVATYVVDRLNQRSREAQRCIAFRTAPPTSRHGYHITLQRSVRTSAQLRGNQSTVVDYKDEHEAVAKLVDLFMPSPRDRAVPLSQFSRDSKAVKYAQKYKLVFSLLNEDASKGGAPQWDIAEALDYYIYPTLRSLSGLHEYDVETQVQYYAPLVVQREVTDDGTFIAEDQLKVFVNSAEWNLASSVSSDPVLHFILYIPASDKRPLYLKREDGSTKPLTFFSIPQWGTVAVHGSEQHEGGNALPAETLSLQELQPAFMQFASSLGASHGVPTLEAFYGSSNDKVSWEIQALMRERTLQNVHDAIQKLGAIAKQANEIQNMRIPKAVQEDVIAALDALASVESENIDQAMRQSANASSLANRASFNHEMLAMLYFPDEHKWAVYTPLFGPIAVPLLVALLREIKEFKKRQREKSKQE